MVCLYSDLLTRIQGTSPEEMHLALGKQEGELASFRVTDYAAYFRSVRCRFLVAGISRRQRAQLEERGVATLAGLARLPLPLDPPLDGVSAAAYAQIREQARIQLEGRLEDRPKYELFTDVKDGNGLLALPEPSQGDLPFDARVPRAAGGPALLED
ncbi:MAG: hypothetical protein Q8N53_17240 [Longimicrobiales bacterium]|nr:hypothetical protein [Longimicrobiales bacterium]